MSPASTKPSASCPTIFQLVLLISCVYREHEAGTTAQQREHALWSPADNETRFWFTRESLVNLLRDTRYTSVFECHAPGYKKLADDRLTMVAAPGRQIAP